MKIIKIKNAHLCLYGLCTLLQINIYEIGLMQVVMTRTSWYSWTPVLKRTLPWIIRQVLTSLSQFDPNSCLIFSGRTFSFFTGSNEKLREELILLSTYCFTSSEPLAILICSAKSKSIVSSHMWPIQHRSDQTVLEKSRTSFVLIKIKNI